MTPELRAKVRPASIWAEAVFHVLAHVDVGRLPASCHNRLYIAWAEARLGAASARSLAADARVVERAATSHGLFARAQALAWVFETAEQCARAAERDLASLAAGDVANAGALAVALGAGALAEVVRAAAELELPALASIGARAPDDAIHANHDEVEAALAIVAPAAPSLAGHDVALVRALGLRGRAFDRSILVGVPGIACPDAEHAAWQAAHEATVVEVSTTGASFEDVERRSLTRLRSRAHAAGLAEAHARWIARLDSR